MGIFVYGRRTDFLNVMRKVVPDSAVFYEDAEEAKKAISSSDIQIIIIGLEKEDTTGMGLAYYFRRIHRYYLTPIIFVADSDCYEEKAFREIRCYDYLYPSVSEKRVREVLYFLMEKMDPLFVPKGLVIRRRHEIYRFETEDILYLEILNKHLVIHTLFCVFELPYHPIGECVAQTQGELIQCHRSMAVNRKYIESIHYGKRRIYLKNCPDSIFLGPKYMKQIRAAFDVN